MAETSPLRRDDAVVRPLHLAADRACSRPSCPAPASATLTFSYAAREAWIAGLATTRAPQSYDLCATHAGRTQPPYGWQLRDRRPADQRAVETAAAVNDDGAADMVAVLAAALRSVPDLPTPEPAAASAPSGSEAPGPAAPGPAAPTPERTGPAPRPILAERRRNPGEAASDW